MGDHDAALRGDWTENIGKNTRNILIGQAVEPVASDPLGRYRARQRESPGYLGLRMVERGVSKQATCGNAG
jgi:hypothetical protein